LLDAPKTILSGLVGGYKSGCEWKTFIPAPKGKAAQMPRKNYTMFCGFGQGWEIGEEDGFFYASPHPGNFFVMGGAVMGAIDFGVAERNTGAGGGVGFVAASILGLCYFSPSGVQDGGRNRWRYLGHYSVRSFHRGLGRHAGTDAAQDGFQRITALDHDYRLGTLGGQPLGDVAEKDPIKGTAGSRAN